MKIIDWNKPRTGVIEKITPERIYVKWHGDFFGKQYLSKDQFSTERCEHDKKKNRFEIIKYDLFGSTAESLTQMVQRLRKRAE